MPASHPSSPLCAQLSTRYLLRTSDGCFIQVQTRGWRTGSKEVLQRLSDAAREGFSGTVPGPDEYKFRLCIEMETDARNEKYAWLNTAMFVGSGIRSGRQGASPSLVITSLRIVEDSADLCGRFAVIYDAYLIE